MRRIIFCLLSISLLTAGCGISNNGDNNQTTSTTRSEQSSETINNSNCTNVSQSTNSNDKAIATNESTAGITEPQNTNSNKVNPIQDNDLQISKYKLNMSLEDFEKVMSNDLEEKVSAYDEALDIPQTIYLFKDGTKIVFSEDILSSISTINSEDQTPRGLKVGDSTTKLVELYGNPKLKGEDGCWEYNYDLEDYTVLYVTVVDGKVSKIEISLAD